MTWQGRSRDSTQAILTDMVVVNGVFRLCRQAYMSPPADFAWHAILQLHLQAAEQTWLRPWHLSGL